MTWHRFNEPEGGFTRHTDTGEYRWPRDIPAESGKRAESDWSEHRRTGINTASRRQADLIRPISRRTPGPVASRSPGHVERARHRQRHRHQRPKHRCRLRRVTSDRRPRSACHSPIDQRRLAPLSRVTVTRRRIARPRCADADHADAEYGGDHEPSLVVKATGTNPPYSVVEVGEQPCADTLVSPTELASPSIPRIRCRAPSPSRCWAQPKDRAVNFTFT